jgi:hypothetical protein
MGLNRYNTGADKPMRFPMLSRSWNPLAACPSRVGIALLACTVAFAGFTGARAADNRYLWQSVSRAQCKVDDKTPLIWNVYQTDKKKEANLVLLLIGHRYLALDIKARLVYNVFPSDLQAKGQGFESGDLFVKSRVLPTNNWSLRDVGPAELIKLTLSDYGRELYVELPHMPDMRAFY